MTDERSAEHMQSYTSASLNIFIQEVTKK